MKKVILSLMVVIGGCAPVLADHTYIMKGENITKGIIPNARHDVSSVTLQGNTLNFSTVAGGVQSLTDRFNIRNSTNDEQQTKYMNFGATLGVTVEGFKTTFSTNNAEHELFKAWFATNTVLVDKTANFLTTHSVLNDNQNLWLSSANLEANKFVNFNSTSDTHQNNILNFLSTSGAMMVTVNNFLSTHSTHQDATLNFLSTEGAKMVAVNNFLSTHSSHNDALANAISTGNSKTDLFMSTAGVWAKSGATLNYGTGNVGIGTLTPRVKFDVATGSVTITNEDNGEAKFIRFAHSGTDYGAYMGVNTSATGDFFIGSIIAGVDTRRVVIQRTNGNVGIGTLTATKKLDVVGDVYVSGDVSALTFTDRTPYYGGDALANIKKIKAKEDGEIDHDSIPSFARNDHVVQVPVYEDRMVEITTGTKVETISKRVLVRTDEVRTPGRSLGAMVSILTKAVQDLMAEIQILKNEIAILKGQ